MAFGAAEGHVDRVVLRNFVLFVTRLVAFVNDDDAKVFEWREYGASRANRNLDLMTDDAPPFVVLLADRKSGMKNCDGFAESTFDAADHQRRQTDFRNQKDRFALLF